MNETKKLLNSLLKSPGMRIMHFSSDSTLVDEIKEFCNSSEYSSEYLIITFNQEIEKRLKSIEDEITKVKYYSENRPKFNIQAKLYDYLFITNLPIDRESFFKRVYSALKNGAPIFIYLQKDQKELAYKIEQELIESNYVATNFIEIDNSLVVSAKKMHGWNNG